ncbi:hypothetical protein VZQ01_01570 [Myxococcus faecalis]|uniref:hypothetical protein n=1 Tax=Myxococcus TaxID=32 RepID=UPI001CBF9147|nr:hypothetical protein [Myxococcus sp. XM-1-1-1]MBZ4412365.1 hypothetical protein [Myxococcus sp. XM-1-1-1]
MTRVSPSEHRLLTLARAILGQGPYVPVEDLFRGSHVCAPQLGPAALSALRDSLSKGTVLALARMGGGRKRRHLPSTSGATRLWERHPSRPLHFSALCFHTLRWLVEQPLTVPDHRALDVDAPPTLADELFLYLCCRMLVGTSCAPALGKEPQFRRSALCRLGFPDVFASVSDSLSADDFAPLLAEGGWLLEAVQDELALRWRKMEESKSRRIEPRELVELGASQTRVLDAFFDALDRARRRDLAGFLLDALRPLVDQPAARWVAHLSPRAPLGAKVEARRGAGAGLRALARLARWDQEHRAVRFFDDDHDDAQLLLSEWSSFGDAGFRLAADRERELGSDLMVSSEVPEDGASSTFTGSAP